MPGLKVTEKDLTDSGIGLDFSGGQFISDVVCSYFFRVKFKKKCRAKMMLCKRMVLSIMVSF